MTFYRPLLLSLMIAATSSFVFAQSEKTNQLRERISKIQLQQEEAASFSDSEGHTWKEALKERQEADDLMMVVLVGELMEIDPDASDLVEYAQLRWQALRRGGNPVKAFNEAKTFLAARPDVQSTNPETAIELAWYRSVIGSPQEAVDVAIEFADAHPKNAEGALLLEAATARLKLDDQQLLNLQSRILDDYPETPSAHRVKLGQPDTEIWNDAFFKNQMTDIVTGNAVSVEDFDGNITLIAHWADWCSPAHKAIQEAVDVYRTHHNEGFRVLGISGDGKLENANSFIEEHSLPWSNISVPWDRSRLQKTAMDYWNHSYTPRFLLVDGQGHVLAQPRQSEITASVKQALAGELQPVRQSARSYDPKNLTGQRAVYD